jgi:hypothetical protein
MILSATEYADFTGVAHQFGFNLTNFDDIRHFSSVLFSSCPFRGALKQQQPRHAFLPPSSSHIGGI